MKNEGLGSWPQRRRVKSADAPAIVFRGETTTYAEFAEHTESLANALRAQGITKGARVAYLGDNHPAFLESLFAVASLGAIFVPLNTRLADPELEYCLADSGASLLLGDRAVGDVRFGVTAQGEPGYVDELVGLDDPAVILYTSGTTGRPKGAVLTHGNLTWNAINVLVDYDVTSSDIAIMISPLFHAASLGMGALPAMLKGACILLEPAFDPGRALELIESNRATWISGVPTTYQLIAEHPSWASRDISSLRILTCGGSPVPLRVLEAYEARGLSFTGGYGMTETSPGATSLQPGRSRDRAGSAGLPHFFTDVRVVDESGGLAKPGEIGEIQVAGPNVVGGYWNRPDDNSFADDGWFRSGDLGSTDDEGFLFIADRLKDMIITGGENIYPVEVEQLILELDAVSAVAVIGVPDEKWGEVPRAIVTLRPGATLTLDAVRAHLEGRLARYKLPRSLVVVDELPRTASGKIRKNLLREA